MNIFYLDPEPTVCAQYHCNTHTSKMVLETGQLLSTAHRVLDGATKQTLPNLYKAAHPHHPSTLWVQQAKGNYLWLYDLFRALSAEFSYRSWGKVHKTATDLMDTLAIIPSNIPDKPFFEPPQCMSDEYRVEGDTVLAYRQYYIGDKQRLLKYSRRPAPDWLENLNGKRI